MTVWVVEFMHETWVFSTEEKACDFMSLHPEDVLYGMNLEKKEIDSADYGC